MTSINHKKELNQWNHQPPNLAPRQIQLGSPYFGQPHDCFEEIW